MDFATYTRVAHDTAIYPTDYTLTGQSAGVVYNALGAAGEVGELAAELLGLALSAHAGKLANQAKKLIRDDAGRITDERRLKLLDEAGDVLWYLNELTRSLGSSLEECAGQNLRKIGQRNADRTLKGDDRETIRKAALTAMETEIRSRQRELDKSPVETFVTVDDWIAHENGRIRALALNGGRSTFLDRINETDKDPGAI